MTQIPPRKAIEEYVDAKLYQIEDQVLLSSILYDEYKPIYAGSIILRFGIPLRGKAHLSIIPEIVALEYGAFFTGFDAWEFIYNSSNLHPRADVVGHLNDGSDDMIPLKHLELEGPVHVLAYAKDKEWRPISQIDAYIVHQPDEFPPLVMHYAKGYTSLEAWKLDQGMKNE
ncbi:hypothetical protein MASR2M15_27820 [Anaerolineales bacterium]